MSAWADQWLINFSPPKTKCLLISWKTLDLNHPPLSMSNIPLTEVESHCHLGVTISANLGWTDHIKSVAARANKRLDIMTSLKYILDRKALEQIYFSLVCPDMEYASVVWHNCNKQDNELLESVQKRAARIISGAIRGTPTYKIYSELHCRLGTTI